MNFSKHHPTHRITTDAGESIDVMLDDDGAAYTAREWIATDAADYERDDDGHWLFQGQPFAGRVVGLAADGSILRADEAGADG